MKQFFFSVMFIMAFCVNGMYAQNVEDVDSVDISVTADEAVSAKGDGKSSSKNSKIDRPKTDNFDNSDVLISKFQAMLEANQKAAAGEEEDILLPLGKKHRWFLTQKIGISVLGGSDSDVEREGAVSGAFDQEDMNDERKQNESKFCGGFSGEYTLTFVRGRMDNERVKINPLGAALSTGVVVSFDNQDKYGTTCDLMLKFGIEAGFSHKMGFGYDLLVGTGKAAGCFYYLEDTSDSGTAGANNDDPDIISDPYTAWCPKVGGQIWFRTGMLSAGNSSDLRLFVRYVYSIDPHKTTEFSSQAFHNDWFEESWQIGLTYCYKF